MTAQQDGTLGIRIADPDGNPIEFTQYLPGSMHAQASGKFLDPRRVSTHIQHAGVGTHHPEAALAFYKDKLGFVEVWPFASGGGASTQWNLKMPGANGDYLELMVLPANPSGRQDPPVPVQRLRSGWQPHRVYRAKTGSGEVVAAAPRTSLHCRGCYDEPMLAIADGLESMLAKDFASLPQVRDVLTEKVDGSLVVWISVDESTPSVRRLVYRKQLAIIEGFPDVDFDFNLVHSMGRTASEVSTTASIAYSRLAS